MYVYYMKHNRKHLNVADLCMLSWKYVCPVQHNVTLYFLVLLDYCTNLQDWHDSLLNND